MILAYFLSPIFSILAWFVLSVRNDWLYYDPN